MSNDNPDVFPVITKKFLSSHISNMLYSSSVVIFHYQLHCLLFYVQHIFFFFGNSSQANVYFLVCSS